MGMGLRSWNTGFEWLRLGIKSFTMECMGLMSRIAESERLGLDWELNQEIPLRLGIHGIISELNSCLNLLI